MAKSWIVESGRSKKITICAQCRRPLDSKENPETGEVFYRHGYLPSDVEDHPVQPILATKKESRPVCDFCMSEGKLYTLPCQTFSMHVLGELHHFMEDWAICEDCAVDIPAGEYLPPVQRWLRNHHQLMLTANEVETIMVNFGKLWDRARKMQTGPIFDQETGEKVRIHFALPVLGICSGKTRFVILQ